MTKSLSSFSMSTTYLSWAAFQNSRCTIDGQIKMFGVTCISRVYHYHLANTFQVQSILFHHLLENSSHFLANVFDFCAQTVLIASNCFYKCVYFLAWLISSVCCFLNHFLWSALNQIVVKNKNATTKQQQ